MVEHPVEWEILTIDIFRENVSTRNEINPLKVNNKLVTYLIETISRDF